MNVKTKYEIKVNDDPDYFPNRNGNWVIFRNGERIPYVFSSDVDARSFIVATYFSGEKDSIERSWVTLELEDAPKVIKTVGNLVSALKNLPPNMSVYWEDDENLRDLHFEVSMDLSRVFFDNKGVLQFLKDGKHIRSV